MEHPRKTISEYTTLYSFEEWQPWNPKLIYLKKQRHAFCPQCSKPLVWDERIDKMRNEIDRDIILFDCGYCGTKLKWDRKKRAWSYHPSSAASDLPITLCPECNQDKRRKHDTIPGFYVCDECGIEFRWHVSPGGEGILCTKFQQKDGIKIMAQQFKEAMNTKYASPDPFKVLTDPADAFRKAEILSVMNEHIQTKRDGFQFKRALDIGCGEGFITKDIPADEIVAYDISDVALSRLEGPNIVVCDDAKSITGHFDCVLAAGVLVTEYDFQGILDLIDKHGCEFVLTCQTTVTEVTQVTRLKGKEIGAHTSPYRKESYTIRIFDYSEINPPAEVTPTGVPVNIPSDSRYKDLGPDSEPIKTNEPIDVTVSEPMPTAEFKTVSEEAVRESEPAIGEDKTFQQIIDEAIDNLPEDSKMKAIVMNDDNHHQLVAGTEIGSHYRGFRLIISAGESFFSFDADEKDDPDSPIGGASKADS